MLKTKEDCTKRLAEIDAEIEWLQLEKKHVSEILGLLQEKPELASIPINVTLGRKADPESRIIKIFEVILNNPGISGPGIRDTLGLTTLQVSTCLSNLKTRGLVENRTSKMDQPGSWYALEQ